MRLVSRDPPLSRLQNELALEATELEVAGPRLVDEASQRRQELRPSVGVLRVVEQDDRARVGATKRRHRRLLGPRKHAVEKAHRPVDERHTEILQRPVEIRCSDSSRGSKPHRRDPAQILQATLRLLDPVSHRVSAAKVRPPAMIQRVIADRVARGQCIREDARRLLGSLGHEEERRRDTPMGQKVQDRGRAARVRAVIERQVEVSASVRTSNPPDARPPPCRPEGRLLRAPRVGHAGQLDEFARPLPPHDLTVLRRSALSRPWAALCTPAGRASRASARPSLPSFSVSADAA